MGFYLNKCIYIYIYKFEAYKNNGISFKNTNEWNVFENESKDEIFNSSDNNGFCLEEPEKNLMKNVSLTSKWNELRLSNRFRTAFTKKSPIEKQKNRQTAKFVPLDQPSYDEFEESMKNGDFVKNKNGRGFCNGVTKKMIKKISKTNKKDNYKKALF